MNNQLKTLFLFSCLTLLIMALGQVLGGTTGTIWAFGLALAINFFAYFFSADIVLAKTGARVIKKTEAPELFELIEHLALRANLPMPKVALLDSPAPNAFATGRNPKNAVVALTSGLVSIMGREELAGVIAHELTHIKHRDILLCSVAAVMAGAIMTLARLAFFTGARGREQKNGAMAGLLVAIIAPLAALLIQAAISRSREYLADDGGADIAGSSLGLASALEKLERFSGKVLAPGSPETASLFIVNPLGSAGLSNLFATHPPIGERIARLRGLVL